MMPTVHRSPTGPHQWDADNAGDLRTRRVVNVSTQTLDRSQSCRTLWYPRGSRHPGCRSEDEGNNTIDALANVDRWQSIRSASRLLPSMRVPTLVDSTSIVDPADSVARAKLPRPGARGRSAAGSDPHTPGLNCSRCRPFALRVSPSGRIRFLTDRRLEREGPLRVDSVGPFHSGVFPS